MDFIDAYIEETQEILQDISRKDIEAVINALVEVRSSKGRVFVLGVGGSAASGSHLVNDLRKLAHIETYTPIDNVSELTARINDEGWESCFSAWLEGSRLDQNDAIFILSVGGGDLERNISPNLVRAIQYAREVGAKVLGIVGRDSGYTAKEADARVVVPEVNPAHVTPHTESFHSVIGHIIVSHPRIKAQETKWESAVQEESY